MNYLKCVKNSDREFSNFELGEIVPVRQLHGGIFKYDIPCAMGLGYNVGRWGFNDIHELRGCFEIVELDNKHDEHYKKCGIEPWDIMQANFTHDEFVGFLKGNILKYLMRIGRKGQDLDDCDKIANYANKLKEVLQKDIRQD